MVQKQRAVKKVSDADIAILKEIAEYDKDLKQINAKLNDIKNRRRNLVWQAQERNITRAGNYELVQVPRVTRSIDMAAMWMWKERELVQRIAKVSLTDAEKVFGKDRLDEVIILTPSVSYKVREIKRAKED